MMASRISLERRGPVRAIATMTPLDGMRGSVPRTLELGGMLTRLGSLSLPYQIATAGVFLVAYVVLEWISFIHEYKGVPVTPWNPGLGVVFALMVLGGPRYGVVLFAGVVIAETTVLQTKLQWPIILGIAASPDTAPMSDHSWHRRHFCHRLRHGCRRRAKAPATRRRSLSLEGRGHPARCRHFRRDPRRASPVAALAAECAALIKGRPRRVPPPPPPGVPCDGGL